MKLALLLCIWVLEWRVRKLEAQARRITFRGYVGLVRAIDDELEELYLQIDRLRRARRLKPAQLIRRLVQPEEIHVHARCPDHPRADPHVHRDPAVHPGVDHVTHSDL